MLDDNIDGLPSLERVYRAAMTNVFPPPDMANKKPDTSEINYYMDSNILFIEADSSPLTLHRIFAVGATAPVAVIHDGGKVVGVITKTYLEQSDKKERVRTARELMIPWSAIRIVDLCDGLDKAGRRMAGEGFLMVMKKGQPTGTLWADDLAGFSAVPDSEHSVPGPEDFAQVFDLFPDGLIITNIDLRIMYVNNMAAGLFNTTKGDIVGKQLDTAIGRYFFASYQDYRRCSSVYEVLKHRRPVYNLERKLLCGRTFKMNYLPVVRDGELACLAIIFRDVTGEKEIIEFSRSACKELTEAFRVMLPTTRIEKKLRAIPEYQDVFDPTTGYVEIIEVVAGGAFRHVINCLNIVSELHKKGIFNVPELDRAVVVQALLLHDIGKKQPVLNVGDVVDPKKVFPDGKKHAGLSAGMVGDYPLVSTDVIPLIFYHHHRENELTADFEDRLLPMWRLIRLVDGLSAAITRRHAQLDIMVEGSRIVVLEKNPHPYYNGVRETDVLSGKSYFNRDII